MQQKYTNKNGVKLLAAIAVFAMIAASIVVVSSDSDAAYAAGKYTSSDGPLNFSGTGMELTAVSGQAFDNFTLRNQITVSYDSVSKTYTVTGILAKQKLTSDSGAFYNLWTTNTEKTYGLAFSASLVSGDKIKVGDGDEFTASGNITEGNLLYIKDVGTAVVKITKAAGTVEEYVIDFTGVTLSESTSTPAAGYVVIPNANALAGQTSGTDGSDGKWSYDSSSGKLTLTNYNGNEYFQADGLTEVVLVGENSITLTGATAALKNNTASTPLTIKSIDGVGSLDIIMNDVPNISAAIDATGKLTINGVDVSITMTEKYGSAPTVASSYYTTKAVNSAGFDIYDASLIIDVATTNYYNAFGIYSTSTVDIKSSEVIIDAGSRGINIDGNANVSIAASDVTIKADQLGIRTGTETAVSMSITNESNVKVEVFGLAQGYYQPYGVSISGYMEVQSDSVLETDGMIVYGNGTTNYSVNNATIINNGDMVIWKGAKFDNAGQFINNGTVGVYGEFKNSKGETVNNGALNNYEQFRLDDTSFVNKAMTSKNSEGKALVITIKAMQPLADGSFLVKLDVAYNGGDAVTYTGGMTYSFGTENAAIGYSIDAIKENGSAILTVSYDSASTTAKYNIYSSENTYSVMTATTVGSEGLSSATNAVLSDDGIAQAVTGNKTNSFITVTGGTFTNKGSVQVNDESTTFVTGGTFSNDGKLELNDNITVTGGKLTGNDAVVAAGVILTLSGEIDMVFSNSGSYTTTVSGNTTTTQYTNVVKVLGKPNAIAITTPTASSILKGFVAISHMDGATGKAATVAVLEGSATISGNIGTDMILGVESGATLQVDKTNGADSQNGVIAVQDGATFNMMVSTDRNTFGYGTLTYTISFANDGYTYYGSLQYALANAAEGATLNLNSTAVINTNTVVKKGITLIFADEKDLSITGTSAKKVTITMEEGAKFVLGKNSDVTIVAEYVTFSGTVVYDVNEIVLDKVKFKTSNATISGAAASTTSASSVAVAIDAVDGTIKAFKGLVTGTINIDKVMQTTDANKLSTTSKLVISEDATFRTNAVADSFVDSKFADTEIDGILELAYATTINGKVSGDGSIILKDGIKVTFANTATASIAVGNGTDAFVFDAANGFAYTSAGAYDSSNSKTFAVSSIAKAGTKAAYVVIEGDVLNGNVTTQGNTVFGTSSAVFTIGIEAVVVVPADSTVTIGPSVSATVNSQPTTLYNSANGLLKVAGTINMKIDDDSTTNNYGKLAYDITYADGDYTVYTILSTGVSNATAGDSFVIVKDLPVLENMEIPAGVTISIAEGMKITVASGKYISIGTPITSIGAVSSIEGTIQLGANAFVVVYADDTVDMSKATIIDIEGNKAKNSQFTLLNEVYATVYVDVSSATTALNNVKSVLVPEIDGYRFLGWNPMTSADIGSTDYEGNLKASMVQVVFKSVDGIKYYVDNVLQNTLGAPVYVEYGSTITALAASGYTGTPLVNGKAYISVTSDLKEVVGSGVSPAVAPEAPSDDGMGITDYLLIVLVVMVVILAVIVCVRMMRS